jgi:hypothetical protein
MLWKYDYEKWKPKQYDAAFGGVRQFKENNF